MLPSDAAMLLSVVNMKLRDGYASLEALCDDLEEDAAEIEAQLAAFGYEYDEKANRFVPKK